MLQAHVPGDCEYKLPIGLYTSKTGRIKGDVNTSWDRHGDLVIIFTSIFTTGADYTANGQPGRPPAVSQVYLFPCMRSCLPRDMAQGNGRFRVLSENEVLVAACERAMAAMPLTREALDARQNYEYTIATSRMPATRSCTRAWRVQMTSWCTAPG